MNEFLQGDFSIPTSTYFYAVVLGIVLYVVLAFLKRYLIPLWQNRHNFRQVSKNAPLMEGVVWAIYIIYVLMTLLDTNPITHIAFVIVFLGASWLFFKDLLAGLVFKLTGKLKAKQLIQVDEYTGKIAKLGYLAIELELSTGEIVVLPYGLFIGQKIIKPNPSDEVKSHTIEIELFDYQPTTETLRMLQELTLYIPWSVITKEPAVTVKKRTETGYVYQIVFYSIDEKYFPDMEKFMREAVRRRTKLDNGYRVSKKTASMN